MYFTEDKIKVISDFNSNAQNGLTKEQVQANFEKYGANKLKEKKKKTILELFLAQLNDPLIYILLIAAIVSGVLKEVSDTIIIMAVVVLNAVIGVTQEAKAEKSMEALKSLSTPKAYVIRDGQTIELESEKIVPGDIVVLDAGRYIPADMRLIETANMQVEESALTGESVPVNKNAELVIKDEKVPLGDKTNMAFSSTLVTSGRGKGIVVATGMDTEIGKIADMLSQEDGKTPLQIKLAEVGKLLGIIALAICAVMFGLAVIQKRDIFEMFLTAVSLAVAAIPEGLPAIVSIVLAIGVQKMVKKNAIVRKLPSVETLGAVNIICSDKTGTLTQNKMTVMKYYYDDKIIETENVDIKNDYQKMLVEGLMLCSDATSDGTTSTGDPTEIALIDAGRKLSITGEDVSVSHPRLNEAPFDSDRKLMSTVNEYGGNYKVFTKGATDVLLDKTISVVKNGEVVPMTQEQKLEILKVVGDFSDQALRVLGLAYKVVGSYEKLEQEDMEKDLVFLGLVAMIDPPRLEVKNSINVCKKAGISTVMITGDHQKTAFAIAKELGIASEYDQSMSGVEIDNYTDEEFKEIVKNKRVFSRVSPQHKVKIVNAFRASDNIVSMTGDGVNDAPSLKAADIGVSMGITGTDVAKGASDIILTDDNFQTIVTAVQEGRNIYANIKKSVTFLLSCNIGEIVAIFVSVLLGWPTPLQSVHLLWINLITDTFPAISLGMDTGDKDIMKEKPRHSKQSLFKGRILFLVVNGVLIGVITLLAFLIGAVMYSNINDLGTLLTHMTSLNLLENAEAERHARTMAFVTLAVSQLFHSFNLRHEKKSIFAIGLTSNMYLVYSLIGGILIQLIVIYVPLLAAAFKVSPLSLLDWAIVVGLSLSVIVLNEIVKIFKRSAAK